MSRSSRLLVRPDLTVPVEVRVIVFNQVRIVLGCIRADHKLVVIDTGEFAQRCHTEIRTLTFAPSLFVRRQ